jgi:uncharacterized protein YukJ
MPLKSYGVLKGTVIGHLRDADDDHYQILVRAGNTLFRIAVNVESAAPNAPSTVLFQRRTSLPASLTTALQPLKPGYKVLPSRPGGLAQDYVRGGLVDTAAMTPVPPDVPGVDNDLKDKIESAVAKAIREKGSVLYAFGERWGPEKKRKDKYFRFIPGNGVHDIHMNQGNSGKWARDNGANQDGCLLFSYPNSSWQAYFFAFQSQTFNTDDNGAPLGSGRPLAARPRAAKKVRRAGA